MQGDKIHYHPRGLASAVLALFYVGHNRREIADRFELTTGAISGLLSRAGAVRKIPEGREPYLFDQAASQDFARLMREGRTYKEAAEALGKSPIAARGHAAALNLIPVDVELSGKKSDGAKTRQAPTVTAESMAADAQASFEAADDKLVAALIAEGGFNRYDDTFDWLLNMHDERVAPVSAKARAEFLEAMRAKHGEAALKIAAA